MDLTPNDVGFDIGTTVRAVQQWQANGSVGPAPIPDDIGTVADILSIPIAPKGPGPGPGTPPGGPGNPKGDPPKINLDWRAYLADWGFPKEVVDELTRIFSTYPDAQGASAAALAYIRGTDWYATTFPGINEGIRKGIITNEQDYRSYVNQLNDLYSRYYGRGVSSAEVGNALSGGKTASHLNAELQGQAYANTQKPEAQYLLGAFGDRQATDSELTAYGQNAVGLDNQIGMGVANKITNAQEKLRRVFEGTLASPSLSLLKSGRLVGSSLGGVNQNDVGA